MSFKLCCDNPIKEEYSLTHEYLANNLKSKLLELVLYLPEMESYQSLHDTLFAKDTYDDYLFELFVKNMKLSIDNDVKYVEDSKPVIDLSDAEYFKDKYCKSCQKIIFHKRKDKTKIIELFRHLRNSIAHGCFNVIDDYFIGFDHPKFNGENYNAVIKVKISNLIETLNIMYSINVLQDLYKVVLENLGYKITDEKETSSFGNLFIEKNKILYCLKFEDFKGRYINQSDIQKVIKELNYIDKTNFIYVLVVDSSYTNKKINTFLRNEHILILDKKYIKEMLNGKDVLEESSRAIIN